MTLDFYFAIVAIDAKHCSRLCNKEDACEAAILNTDDSSCSLYEMALINATESATPNNMIYMESVCGKYAVSLYLYFNFISVLDTAY